MDNLNVVLFAGGRGCSNIIKSLLKQTSISLSIVINGYDNGKSTGTLRSLISGMLGASDFRKNVSTVLESQGKEFESHFLEKRMQLLGSDEIVNRVVQESHPSIWDNFSHKQYQEIVEPLVKLDNYLSQTKKKLVANDMAVGNLILAGLYIQSDFEFNRAVKKFQDIFLSDLPRVQIQNVTDGENLFLVARATSGKLFLNEAEIVVNHDRERIKEIALVKDPSLINPEDCLPSSLYPKPNMDVIRDLSKADLIIYGPGTQASSLLPSYLTEGIAEAVTQNISANKVFISNLVPDEDDPFSDVSSRLESFFDHFSRIAPIRTQSDLVTHVFTEISFTAEQAMRFHNLYPNINFRTDDWLVESNKHLGAAIVRQLNLVTTKRMNYKFGLISVLLPSIDFDRVTEFIESLSEMLPNDYEYVLILEEGFAAEQTKIDDAIIRKSNIRIVESLTEGIRRCRGDLVCYVESLELYLVSDVALCIRNALEGHEGMVLGSRNLKLLDIRNQIKTAYVNRPIRGLIAYWGGFLLSVSILLRFRRFVSDPLSGLKVWSNSSEIKRKSASLSADIHIGSLKHFVAMKQPLVQIPISFRTDRLNKLNQHGILRALRSLLNVWNPIVREKL